MPYFSNLKFLLEQSYQKIGDGMRCESKTSVYTHSGGKSCDGWNGISLTECKTKCTKNEVPSNCPQTSVRCKYVEFNTATNWCHLGDYTCKPVQGAGELILTMKQGLCSHDLLMAFDKPRNF